MGLANNRHGEETAALVAHFLTCALLMESSRVRHDGKQGKAIQVSIGGKMRSLSPCLANTALWVYSLCIRVKVGEVDVPSLDIMYVPLPRLVHRSMHPVL
jgi:hypothetical protein